MSRRCLCSFRALELFIVDFSGLRVRPTRLHPHPRRNFGARPQRRQLETTCVGRGLEDGFVPFEDARSKRGEARREREVIKGDGEGMEDEEWHAEMEIATPWPSGTMAAGVEGPVNLSAREDAMPTGSAASAVDTVELQSLHPPSAVGETIVAASPGPHEGSVPAATGPHDVKSRAQNRLERKQRRIQAGTWAPKQAERGGIEHLEEDDQTASVLNKIEALEGPSLAMVQGKEKKTKPPAEEGEKKAKRTREDSRKTKKAATSDRGKSKSDPAPAKPKRELWQVQKSALGSKFGTAGWNPPKRLSPDTMSGIRALHVSDPASYTTATLASHFQITPEAIRRILSSKWRPSEEETEERRQRWERRGVRKWDDMARKGIRPPKRWREAGVGWDRKKGRGGMRETASGGGELGGKEGVGMLMGVEDGREEERIL